MEREELQKIISEAKKWAKIVDNPDWVYAYTQLAMAADHLDAMIARTTVLELQ